jgi:hypothetical protein
MLPAQALSSGEIASNNAIRTSMTGRRRESFVNL